MKLVFGGVALGVFLLFGLTATAAAQNDVTVYATVPGQAPAVAPVIESPASGITAEQQQIEIKGICQVGLVVKVFRNGIFAGSALCQSDGTFSMQIDVMDNRNDLVARQYDLLSQSSPASETVTIFYVSSQPELINQSQQTANFQLVIDYDYNFQGIFVNEPFNLPVHFAGGSAPYAVSIDWGDSDTKVFSREDAGQFHAEHTFSQAGPHTVKIHISDKNQQEATLQFVLIVNGGAVAALPLKGSELQQKNQEIWNTVLFSSVATGAVSFTAGFVLATFWESIRLKITGQPKIDPPTKPKA